MNTVEQDYRNRIESVKAKARVGFEISPILALRDGTVVDGAHRVIAARELGIPISVVFLDLIAESVDPNMLKTWLDKDGDGYEIHNG